MSDVDNSVPKPSKAVNKTGNTVTGSIKVMTRTLNPRKHEVVDAAQREFESNHPGVKNVTLDGFKHHTGTSVTYNFKGEL